MNAPLRNRFEICETVDAAARNEIYRFRYRRPGGRAGDGPVITVRPDRARSLSNGSGSCIRHRCRRHNRETFMFARLLIVFYAIVSYAVFLVSFLYAVGFVGNYLVPTSIDVGGRTNLSEAIVVDLLLLGILRSFRTVSPFAW